MIKIIQQFSQYNLIRPKKCNNAKYMPLTVKSAIFIDNGQ